MKPEGIAIVGIGGLFPQAPDLDAYWKNLAGGVCAVRDVPEGRWLLSRERAYDPARGAADKVYSTKGCFVEGFTFDPAGLDLDPTMLAGLDPVFHFALHAGRQAFADAVTSTLDRRRVGIVIGNIALPTDAFSAYQRRVLGAEFAKAVPGAPPVPAGAVSELNRYPAGLPGGLLAKGLGLGGGAYTLDAACASSLYALKLACDALLDGRADAMLTGGVSRPECLYTQMGFSQLRALSASGRPAPLDASGDGLVVGEGAGIFVLKRLDDALRAGDKVYAVVRGIGLSNDVGGSLLAPDGGGQLRAMRAAYERSGWAPRDVDLIECHATGTPVGDATELNSLKTLWGEKGWRPGQCALGSAKSNVGHLLTGAGAAGLMKVLLALRERTIPPSANYEKPVGGFDLENSPFRVPTSAAPWKARPSGARRAAVSAFGFGGINAHVLLEEWTTAAKIRRAPSPPRAAPAAVAVVGMEARFGKLNSLRAFQEAVLTGQPTQEMGQLSVPLSSYRIPPKELEEMLPQQVLMLQAADAALRDAGAQNREHERTGVFVGMELDPNTANFHFRWSLPDGLRDSAGPALNANRTMGALGGIIASRIAREFRIGGPSFTMAADETAGLHALEAARRAVASGELDHAIAGAVEVGMNRASGEGAAAVVLKRLDDALRDGDRVYCVLKAVGAAATPEDAAERAGLPGIGLLEACGAIPKVFAGDAPDCAVGGVEDVIGKAGPAAGLASFVKAALAVYQQILPRAEPRDLSEHPRLHAPRRAQYWLRNRADGPRRAAVAVSGQGGNCVHAVLEELEVVPPNCERPVERRQPLGARSEGLFVLEEESAPGLITASRRLRAWLEGRPSGRGIEALARDWWEHSPALGRKALALSFVARDAAELEALAQTAEASLLNDPSAPIPGMERIFYSPLPLGRTGRIAFVFPGSGNQYIGMGLDAAAQWPEVLRAQDAENERLLDQNVPRLFAPWQAAWPAGWEETALEKLTEDHKAMIFGQVSHGTILSDLVRRFGVNPDAVIGYSLGETAGLFAMRVWKARDEMLRRMQESDLFVSELAGPCNAARRSWGLAAHEAVDWALGVVDRPEKLVRTAVSKMEKVFVLIVNTPKECVVGGTRQAVRKMVKELGGTFLPLQGVTTVHCSVAREVETAYHDLHLLPTGSPGPVQFYSGAWARPYEVTSESAAEAITAQAVGGIDYPAVIERAYEDGVRLFLEMGPRNTCTRMIDNILAERPHAARSACVRDQDDVSTVLRLLGQLAAERAPLDLAALYGGPSHAVGHRPEEREAANRLVMPLRRPAPKAPPKKEVVPPPSRPPLPLSVPPPVPPRKPFPGVLGGLVTAEAARAEAHARFLKLAQTSAEAQLRALKFQSELVARMSAGTATVTAPPPAAPAVFMDREQCLEFAIGRIGSALGESFAAVDSHPTRVRLPDEPLMLVDRILSVKGEPRSMTSGTVVTEHDIHPGSWYLDGGRIPTCIAVEAGQADLFLSGYLGIDFETKGKAMYRLLDAVVTFHRGLPQPGEVIRYDINIERFARQGDTWIFFFNFESTVGGRPLLSMRKGCAGFFTQEQLAAGKGIVFTELDKRPIPGKRTADWKDLVPMAVESYDDAAVQALRDGNLAAAFGPAFARFKDPQRLPGGRMKLVDRVLSIDPHGGRFGLGLIRAEADIHPDDWFLTCHFSDDQVMPGTLMFECCMHTLRIFLTRMGWVGERATTFVEPLPGVASQLKCRGQVLSTTKKVVYEISIKEVGYGPEPYAIADALMYADGHPIVLITDMSARLGGLTRELVESSWSAHDDKPLYDSASILAFAVGKPSEAFGAPYKVFDEERIIARLPGPPYKFLDRITSIEGGRPFVLEPGCVIEADYDVPPEEWYFASNKQKSMPFAVILEIALQPCGWLAAYLGSALRSDEDLSFRNLGGKAVLLEEVFPDAGTLTTKVKITRVSQSAGMIIQNFDFEMSNKGRVVYKGDTYFGFFSKEALSDQKGILGVTPYAPTAEDRARSQPVTLRDDVLPLPDETLRMFDSVPLFIPDGGPKGLGFIRGVKKVDPSEWFFKAHFHQDPVIPGSLGLESFQQLLKVIAQNRWGGELRNTARFTPITLNVPHEWVYRGQVVPRNKVVTVEATVTAIDDIQRRITADGFLSVDGLLIYQMKGFTLSVE